MQNQQTSTSQLLTIKQFCLIYNMDVTTVRKRIKLGQIEAYRKPGGRGGSQVFIKDPGWEKVLVPEKLKKGKEFDPKGIYIFRGIEVARFLGVDPRTIRRWARDGRIGYAKSGLYGARNRRYCLEDIRKMMVLRQTDHFKQNRPSAATKRKAVMDWGYKELGLQPPSTT